MNQYKFYFICVIACLFFTAQAQDVEKKLDEAKASYKDGNMENARYALQQALNEIDLIIAKKVLDILPASMGGMDANTKDDQVSGSVGSVGLTIHRGYGTSEGDKSAEINIVGDSPMLAGINTILAMPNIAGMSDPNQKRIKVDGYKALLDKNVNEDGTIGSYDVMVPFGNSLLTFNCVGFEKEGDVISMVSEIPVSKIADLTK